MPKRNGLASGEIHEGVDGLDEAAGDGLHVRRSCKMRPRHPCAKNRRIASLPGKNFAVDAGPLLRFLTAGFTVTGVG